jgi:hypothetical protein
MNNPCWYAPRKTRKSRSKCCRGAATVPLAFERSLPCCDRSKDERGFCTTRPLRMHNSLWDQIDLE